MVGKLMGWRPAFLIAALPGFVLSAAVWLLREPRGTESGGRRSETRGDNYPTTRSVSAMLKPVLSVPTLLVLYLAGTLLAIAVGGLTYWIPSFAMRHHGFSQGEIGAVIGVTTILSGSAGTLSGGFLADRLLRRTPSARLVVIGTSYLAGFPLAVMTLLAPTRELFLILAAMTIYLFTFYSPCVGPLIHQVVRPGLWSTAAAVYLLIIHVLGYATAPALVGWISDRTGDLRVGMLTLLLTALAGGLVGLWGTRFVRQDARVAALPPD
jgi:sugar phosphate permease